jgi:hypothetical protein
MGYSFDTPHFVLTARAFRRDGTAARPARRSKLVNRGRIDAVVTDTTTGKALDLGDGKVFYALESVMVVRAANGDGLLHDMTGYCVGLEEVQADTGAGTLNGRCTYVDADGDQIFETLQITRASLKDEATGRATLTGGTGKYKGIRGELIHTRRLLLPSAAESVFPGVGTLTGSYEIR